MLKYSLHGIIFVIYENFIEYKLRAWWHNIFKGSSTLKYNSLEVSVILQTFYNT